jgi:hypothetical protein
LGDPLFFNEKGQTQISEAFFKLKWLTNKKVLAAVNLVRESFAILGFLHRKRGNTPLQIKGRDPKEFPRTLAVISRPIISLWEKENVLDFFRG